MFFKSSPKITRSGAALMARDLALDFLSSEKPLEDWIMQSDSIIEENAARIFSYPDITKAEIAQILRQSLYFLIERRDDLSRHIKAMEIYKKASEKGILLNHGSQIAEYMDDIPYLQQFRE